MRPRSLPYLKGLRRPNQLEQDATSTCIESGSLGYLQVLFPQDVVDR